MARKVIFKTFTFYDHKHGYVYNVYAKNRREARKKIDEKVLGKIWDNVTDESAEAMWDNVFEVNKVLSF